MKHRKSTDSLYYAVVVAGTLAAALVAGSLLFLIVRTNPLKAYGILVTQPFSSIFGIAEILVRATPLMLVALGVAISFRSGIFNIGGEGQIMIGTLSGVSVALFFPGLPPFLLVLAIFLASFAGGAVWGGIAGWLKARLQVNEILSTIMLNYIAEQVYSYLLRGPLIDPNEVAYGTGTAQTAQIAKAAWLPRLIRGQRVNEGLFIALALAVVVYVFLWRTTTGYRMRCAGAEKRAARYAGISVERYLVLAMALAGGFAGMAGAGEVCGIHHRALQGISAGYGFSGIVVALFGGLHPLGIIPAAGLFGVLIIGADMMQRSMGIPSFVIYGLQGLVILAIVSAQPLLANSYLKTRFERLIRRRTTAAAPAACAEGEVRS